MHPCPTPRVASIVSRELMPSKLHNRQPAPNQHNRDPCSIAGSHLSVFELHDSLFGCLLPLRQELSHTNPKDMCSDRYAGQQATPRQKVCRLVRPPNRGSFRRTQNGPLVKNGSKCSHGTQ